MIEAIAIASMQRMINMSEVEVGRIVYMLFGIGGIISGILGIGIGFINRKPKHMIIFSFILIGGIISFLAFASTFGRLVW